jgi:DNA-binding PadR family transcriptional regulator
MARRTATTAHALLGLLALRGEWSTWELAKQLRRNMRFFWPRAESQIYEEAKSLVARGWARDRRTFTGERARTNYAITAKGRKELAAWMATPPNPTSLECEGLLRVFLADFATAAQVRAAIDQVRADGQAILDVGRVVGAEYLAGTAPFQDQLHVRAFVFDFLSHHAQMLIDWAERTQAALDAHPDPTTAARQRHALAAVADVLARYPPLPADQ